MLNKIFRIVEDVNGDKFVGDEVRFGYGTSGGSGSGDVDIDLSNYVTLDGIQDISGTKTFTGTILVPSPIYKVAKDKGLDVNNITESQFFALIKEANPLTAVNLQFVQQIFDTIVVPIASNEVPHNPSTTASAGTSDEYARADHVHEAQVVPDVATDAPRDPGKEASVGTSSKYAREDHVHKEQAMPDVMTGATATSAGGQGLVPAPMAGNDTAVLQGNGEWVEPLKWGKTVTGEIPSDEAAQDAIVEDMAVGGSVFFTDGGQDAASNRYVKKSGDEMTGVLNITRSNGGALGFKNTSGEGNILSINAKDKDDVTVAGQYVFPADEGSKIVNRFTAISGSTTAQLDLASISGGSAYASCNHPREDNYYRDIVTTKYAIDHFPQRMEGNKIIHLGGTGASDTADLNTGRGESSDKPFASFLAAMRYALNKYVGSYIVTILLHSDITIPDTNIESHHILRLDFKSDDSNIYNVTATGTKHLFRCNSGVIMLSRLNITAPSNIECFFNADGQYRNGKIRISGNSITLNGTVTRGTLFLNGESNIYIDSAINGNVTGKKYYCANGAKIITGGLAGTAIPGSQDGQLIYGGEIV